MAEKKKSLTFFFRNLTKMWKFDLLIFRERSIHAFFGVFSQIILDLKFNISIYFSLFKYYVESTYPVSQDIPNRTPHTCLF